MHLRKAPSSRSKAKWQPCSFHGRLLRREQVPYWVVTTFMAVSFVSLFCWKDAEIEPLLQGIRERQALPPQEGNDFKGNKITSNIYGTKLYAEH